jgi:hypothetical protein
MGLRETLERFLAGQATAELFHEQVELAEARSAATEAKLRVLEANLQSATARCAMLEAEKHFLQVQLIQAQPQRTQPLDEETPRRA